MSAIRSRLSPMAGRSLSITRRGATLNERACGYRCKCSGGDFRLSSRFRACILSTDAFSCKSAVNLNAAHRYNRNSMMRRVYLDNNATTPALPEVLEAMRPYFGEHFGNASSIHHHGQETRAAVERARESVAALLGCRASEVVFTSGGTEADNLAIFGLASAGAHVITSTVEHHAVLNACKHLAAKGCEVTYLPVDGRGLVDPADVKRALRPNTKLITIMFANNETGVVEPVAEIGKIAAEADVYFHTDAVQAASKVPID